ncbi:uncharacterized protein LOC129219820 [Uloborus diversus]|uniref:uncharacterized protein LOC129219820 n=1 Tax=Uloborus diversus TaxID=327109 RepID=UPI0024091C3A|nr:uncharacterized protein LOC129219820 [Uloborus diversus]
MLKTMLIFSSVVLIQSEKNELLMKCSFQTDTCGFLNQDGMLAMWKRLKTEIAGRKGSMMVVEPSRSGKQRARLLSPFFELQVLLPACLHFETFLSGEGVSGLRVEQIDDSGSTVLVGIHTSTYLEKIRHRCYYQWLFEVCF